MAETARSPPPDTSITTTPEALAIATDASFAFAADEPNVSFSCQLDAGAWEPCTSPQRYSRLADGRHRIRVRGADAAGNVDASPASYAWSVDTVSAPVAALSASANPIVTGDAVTFDASASESRRGGAIAGYAWDLDGDGRYETDTGTTPTVRHTYDARGVINVGVRVTDRGGLTGTAAVAVDVRPSSPSKEIGISINNGAVATNDPHVTLTLAWPRLTAAALISNDGGFGAAGMTAQVPIVPTVPWTLASHRGRFSRTVYVRFGEPPQELERPQRRERDRG